MKMNLIASLAVMALLTAPSIAAATPWRGGRAAAADKNTTTAAAKDDLTSEYAIEIIRRAKAAEIASMMNVQAQPCDDFFQFACGSWKRSNPAQLLGNIITDKFQMLAKGFDRRLHRFLHEARRGDALDYKVRDFYQACRVAKDDPVLYRADLEAVFKEFGAMPVLVGAERWQRSDEAAQFVWWEVSARIAAKYGTQLILAVDVMKDVAAQGGANRLYLGPPDMSQQSNSKLIATLQGAVAARVLERDFGVASDVAQSTAKELVDFESKLVANGADTLTGLTLQDMLQEVSVDQLAAKYAGLLDVRRYLAIVFNTTELPASIYVYDEPYLNKTLSMIGDLPKSSVANYLLWQLLQDFLVKADPTDMASWCVERTKKHFGRLIDHTIYARYRSAAREEEVRQVWAEIRGVFRDELRGNKLDWIEPATRELAVEKLEAMQLVINSHDDENFNATYGALKIDRLNYVTNVQQMLMQESREKRAHLHGPPKTVEADDVMSYTPAYNVLDNTIKLPVALLQPHYFWDAQYPQALKYGTLGYLIAHETIHGFDDEGRNFDKRGQQAAWWDAKSAFGFDERRKCFQAQYHNYKFGGKALPESVGQSENIADNAAVKLAYTAYTRWLASRKADDAEEALVKETLPGLPYDSAQLFFIAFAQVWCDDVQSLFRSSIAASDTHAPGTYRVIGSLSNYQEFAWSFKCPRDAPMDPEFKCSIY